MKRLSQLFIAVIIVTGMVSCKDNTDDANKEKERETEKKDSLEITTETSREKETEADTDNDMTVTQEEAEAKKKAEANQDEEVPKLSFCDCVKKQKKIENMLATTEDDAVMDSLFTAMENMKTGECEVLFEGSQASPESRAERKRKIQACLN